MSPRYRNKLFWQLRFALCMRAHGNSFWDGLLFRSYEVLDSMDEKGFSWRYVSPSAAALKELGIKTNETERPDDQAVR